MNKETKKDIKSKVLNGASVAAGATVGAAAGNATAMAANAAEVSEEAETPETAGTHGTSAASAASSVHDTPAEENIQVIETNPEHQEQHAAPSETVAPGVQDPQNISEPSESFEPIVEEEPEIIVTGYGTVSDDAGNPMDVAVVNVDGQETFVVDADQDGIANVLITDINGDGVIDENEIVGIEDEDIYMDSFQNELNDAAHTLLADNDYVNDANIDDYDYMA